MIYLASCIVVGWAAIVILPFVLLLGLGILAAMCPVKKANAPIVTAPATASLNPFDGIVKFWKAL